MRSTVARAAVLAALGATTLTGCGKDNGPHAEPGFTDKSYDEVKSAVIEDMKSAQAVHMSGTVAQGGKQLALDLSLDTAGECDGTISIDGATASVRSVGGTSYFKGDDTFWKAVAGPSADMIVALVGDKWAKLPSSGDAFSSLCDLDEFTKQLDDDSGTTDPKVVGTSQVDGQEALELQSTEEGGTVHVFVTTADPHYILRMSKEGGADAGSLDFTDYGKPLSIEAPTGDEVVDLSKLGG